MVSKVWLTLWNTYSFFVTYANLDGWTPKATTDDAQSGSPIDRWALARLNALAGERAVDVIKKLDPSAPHAVLLVLDATTGQELWRASGLNPGNDPYYRIVASSVAANDVVFAPSRVRPLLAVRAGGRAVGGTVHLRVVRAVQLIADVNQRKRHFSVQEIGAERCERFARDALRR